jgi:hypothetical protein
LLGARQVGKTFLLKQLMKLPGHPALLALIFPRNSPIFHAADLVPPMVTPPLSYAPQKVKRSTTAQNSHGS